MDSGKGRLSLVSAAYGNIRTDRPLQYYLRPLTDFLRRYRETGGSAELVVHANAASWQCAGELAELVDRAVCDEPEDHVQAIWADADWIDNYQRLIRLNPTHHKSCQARFPRLIGVYLSKMRLVKLAFEGGSDVVLWHDAGHWVSAASGHDLTKYSSEIGPGLTDGRLMDRRLLALAAAHPVLGTFCRSGTWEFHMPHAWMREHALRVDETSADLLLQSLYPAALWLFHCDAFGLFYRRFRAAWNELVRRGHAGTEENALTIAAWSLDVPGLLYPDWQSVLWGTKTSVSPVWPQIRGFP
jgi:hypothetical protein